MRWRNCRLGEVLKLKRGHDLPADTRHNGNVPVVSSSGITGYHNEAKATAPGVITGRYGTLGKVFYLEQDYWPLNTALYVVDFKDNHPKFISYFLRNVLRDFQSDKAAVPGVDRNVLHEIKVRIPDLKSQESIASALSVYDDLIGNNQRRIQLLEQAARLLYKEWFVYLRFPGHEHVKIKDGVPDGWERKTAFDVMDILSGGTPKTNVPGYWEGDIPFYTPKDSADYAYVFNTEKTLTADGLRNCNSKLYPKDTIFITARGTVGKINLAQTHMAMNQSCYALVARKPLTQYFLFFALVEGVNQFRSRAVGAVFNAIIVDTFRHIPFLVPREQLIQTFTDYVSPILRQVEALSTQTRKLTKAREILLPRLMNGEIQV